MNEWFKFIRRFMFHKFNRCPYCFRKLKREIESGDYGSIIAEYDVCPKEECKFNEYDNWFDWIDEGELLVKTSKYVSYDNYWKNMKKNIIKKIRKIDNPHVLEFIYNNLKDKKE